MEGWFGEGGWLYRFLSRLWDLIVLNILFLVTSIPLVTIGASTAALYTVTLKAVKKEESYIAKSYLKAWKENFGKATLIFLLLAAVFAVLGVDIFVLGKNSGFLGSAMVLAGGLFGILWLLAAVYALPLQARFENSIPNTLLNGLLVAVKFFPSTIQIVGILAVTPVLAVLLSIFSPTLLGWFCSLYLFAGFSGVAYLTSLVYRRVFDRLEQREIEQAAQEERAKSLSEEKVTKGCVEK